MNVTPMLMTSGNVRKILDGKKTQTRRQMVIDPELDATGKPTGWFVCPYGNRGDYLALKETFWCWGYWIDLNLGLPGKPQWSWVDETDEAHPVLFESETTAPAKTKRETLGYHKKPSMFLPKTEWKTFLRIKDIRVERLQEISEEDAIAEGIVRDSCSPTQHGWKSYETYPDGTPHPHAIVPNRSPITSFMELWQSINGQPRPGKPDISWASNCWVWVITFEQADRLRLSPNGQWAAPRLQPSH